MHLQIKSVVCLKIETEIDHQIRKEANQGMSGEISRRTKEANPERKIHQNRRKNLRAEKADQQRKNQENLQFTTDDPKNAKNQRRNKASQALNIGKKELQAKVNLTTNVNNPKTDKTLLLKTTRKIKSLLATIKMK